jgi:hypothetical protein
MSVEALAEAAGQAADRRTLLRRVGGASLGAVAAALGVASTAEASHCPGYTQQWRCCCLCNSRDPNFCTGRSWYCCWTWQCCCDQACDGDKVLNCTECYGQSGWGCNQGCNNGILCSTAYWNGNYC